ncbi:unnamed protein product [Plasmodium vivax]|uniref:Pv-fam-b protein n=6 Tax=Plasmodium vivax TaxID=5855 RepID=A5KBS4_PLAVS|nr:Pv-fam-b protein [Plasmodium vivax]KMZ82198.1 Pv-fam-b protein [Plasmodium vivax India VII]KMZ88323.1 Pv-fam-b protein [Plasmodium vivax Brazil I]KMZ94688.1 Pv-fam-b protein [Plasmodium vivax Mauritania I]KNA01498.1 Pv-fam-b protein [Plasmodium vivax North Korean]EDL43120.1 Pv-fam-b protein [Plasmodium vivax]|eukprot:XP_001612847.1 Pv-fam-b protein [Plasmodium vivax Sal-1]
MMIATLPRVFLLVFLPLAHNYDSGSSSCSVQLRKNNFAETSQLRTSRLLVADIDTELESVYDSEASFWNIKNRYEEDQSDAETVYEESLAGDEKEKIPLKGRSGLSYTIDKRMLEKIENKGILKCLEHDEEIRENEERLNLLKQKIMNSKIYNAEDQQKLLEGLEKINMMKEKLTKMKLMNTQVLKMIDNQKKLREDGGLVQSKPSKAARSSDGMRKKKKSVRNPIRMLDSQIEKKIFEACRYIDECKNDPNISKQKYKMRKFKKYCLLFGLPFVLIVSTFSYLSYDAEPTTMFVFAVAGFMLILYILMKKMRSDKKKRDISKPRFKDHSESSKRSLK